jgi:hypothetical protein
MNVVKIFLKSPNVNRTLLLLAVILYLVKMKLWCSLHLCFPFIYHHVFQFKTEKSSTSKQFEWLPFLSLSVNVYYQTHSDGHFRKQFTLGLKNKSSIDLGWQFVKGYYAIVISKTLVKYLKARNNNTIKCKWFH